MYKKIMILALILSSVSLFSMDDNQGAGDDNVGNASPQPPKKHQKLPVIYFSNQQETMTKKDNVDPAEERAFLKRMFTLTNAMKSLQNPRN